MNTARTSQIRQINQLTSPKNPQIRVRRPDKPSALVLPHFLGELVGVSDCLSRFVGIGSDSCDVGFAGFFDYGWWEALAKGRLDFGVEEFAFDRGAV